MSPEFEQDVGCVYVYALDNEYIFACNIEGCFACNIGGCDTEDWKNGTDYPYNMHICTIRSSDLERRRVGTVPENEKLGKLMESVLKDKEKEKDMTSEKVKDEVINRLNDKKQKWTYVGVGNVGGIGFEIGTSRRLVGKKGSKYNIFILYGK